MVVKSGYAAALNKNSFSLFFEDCMHWCVEGGIKLYSLTHSLMQSCLTPAFDYTRHGYNLCTKKECTNMVRAFTQRGMKMHR